MSGRSKKGPFHVSSILVFTDSAKIQVGWDMQIPELTFSYTGSDTIDLLTFLAEARFSFTDVTNVQSPLFIRADGSRVKGVEKNNQIEWQNGIKNTPDRS